MDRHGKRTSHGNDRGKKKRNMGRNEYFKTRLDKRARNEAGQEAKRRRTDQDEAKDPVYATTYTKEEIESEERKPKRKAAVLIGYNGSGYKGLQLDHTQKTIEGEIFQAFVKAGAISKANADEPKKSSFGRCARTDKGVHAAGNLLSLKLIIEDPEIVAKINDNLSPQIRVWGIQRTNNSFSAYQMVDSRVYEYLIPTSSFLPPHPKSYLGRKIKESAEENKDIEEWRKRQEEVESYWEDVDEREINPILEKLDEQSRQVVHKALFPTEEDYEGILQAESSTANEPPATVRADVDKDIAGLTDKTWIETNKREIASGPAPDTELNMMHHRTEQDSASDQSNLESVKDAVEFHSSHKPASTGQTSPAEFQSSHELASTGLDSPVTDSSIAAINTPSPSQVAIKDLRAAYISAKRAYRIHPRRLERVKDGFKLYQGTKNFHNYTVGKHYRDPSSKRIIKSFTVNPEPIIINGTEWLSLKVHGQSFMMHQIRKMVSMVALVVRCGCDPERIVQTYGSRRVGIPKAPGLGLLLERPVFDSYNSRCKDYGRDPLDFGNHEQQINEFKQKSIYEKIYQDEERENVFGNFFNHLDNFQQKAFLFVTSGGLEATQGEDLEAKSKVASGPSAEEDSDLENGAKDLAAGEDG